MAYLCPFPGGCNFTTCSNEELKKHFIVIHSMPNQQQMTNSQGLQFQRMTMQHCVPRVVNPNIFNLQFNFNALAPICGIFKIIDIAIEMCQGIPDSELARSTLHAFQSRIES